MYCHRCITTYYYYMLPWITVVKQKCLKLVLLSTVRYANIYCLTSKNPTKFSYYYLSCSVQGFPKDRCSLFTQFASNPVQLSNPMLRWMFLAAFDYQVSWSICLHDVLRESLTPSKSWLKLWHCLIVESTMTSFLHHHLEKSIGNCWD